MKTAIVVLAVLMLVACGEEQDIESTSDMGAKLIVEAGSSFRYVADDVDAAFTAAVVEPIGDRRYVEPEEMTVLDLDFLEWKGLPTVRFVKHAADYCAVVHEHGCYARGEIVVESMSDLDVGTTAFSSCVAVRTRLSHHVAHFVQDAYEMPVEDAPPFIGIWGEDLPLQTQRWLYRWRCG